MKKVIHIGGRRLGSWKPSWEKGPITLSQLEKCELNSDNISHIRLTNVIIFCCQTCEEENTVTKSWCKCEFYNPAGREFENTY